LIRADASLRESEKGETTDEIVDKIFGSVKLESPREMKAVQATKSDIDAFVSSPLTRVDTQKVEDFDLDSLFDDFT